MAARNDLLLRLGSKQARDPSRGQAVGGRRLSKLLPAAPPLPFALGPDATALLAEASKDFREIDFSTIFTWADSSGDSGAKQTR